MYQSRLAPTQSEPPAFIAQVVTLVLFGALGVFSLRHPIVSATGAIGLAR